MSEHAMRQIKGQLSDTAVFFGLVLTIVATCYAAAGMAWLYDHFLF